jgi:hypothetical protein
VHLDHLGCLAGDTIQAADELIYLATLPRDLLGGLPAKAHKIAARRRAQKSLYNVSHAGALVVSGDAASAREDHRVQC